MYCSKCGTKQREEEKFCPKCGNPFSEKTIVNEKNSSIIDKLKDKADGVVTYAKGPLSEKIRTTAEKAREAAEPMAQKISEQLKSKVNEIHDEFKNANSEKSSTSDNKWNLKKILWGVLFFFIPIVGVIYFFVKKKENLSMAKFSLYCAIAGFALNMINYCSSDSDEYEEEYYESSYSESSSTSQNDVWKQYIGKWEHIIVLEPDGRHTMSGYGGSIHLTINSNGTADVIVTSAQFGQEKVVMNTSGDIRMSGNTLSISGASVRFTLNGNSVYTNAGERMKRKY